MAADVAEVVGYSEDAASPLTVLKPASFAAGEMLVFLLGQDGLAVTSLTKPADWSDITSVTGGGVPAKAWYHVYTGADPASWDFGYDAGSDVAGQLWRVTGADTTTPTFTFASTAAGPNAGAMTGPSVTPTGINDLAIGAIFVFGAGNALVETDPAGWTDRGQAQLLTFQAIASVSKQLASGAATGTLGWSGITPANANGASMTIAIKSASASTPDASPPRPQIPPPLLFHLVAANQHLYAGGEAVRVAAQTGTTTAPAAAAGTARKTVIAAGSAATAATARSTATKTAGAAGRAAVAAVASGTVGSASVRAQTGTTAVAAAAAGTVRRVASPSGRTVTAGCAGGTARRIAPASGRATVAAAAAGAARGIRAQAGTAQTAAAGTAAARKTVPAAGAARAAAGARSTAGKRALTAGRAVVAVSAAHTASPSTVVGLAGEAHGPDAHPPGAVTQDTDALAGARTAGTASTGHVDYLPVAIPGTAGG